MIGMCFASEDGSGRRWLLPVALVAAWISHGCSIGATLVKETPNGGIVTYSFKNERGGPLLSPYRKRAFELMEKRCPQGYRLLREGEARGYGSGPGLQEGTEDEPIGRRWGIQFECK
ncbi:MAG TPA: hypothetical protein VNK46_05120 [Nitrospiraceae bacterium]|jgi:hypothetical protein|nr:hypothetical protein [Nitrospiraceae bacterium]